MFAFIAAEKARFSVRRLCAALAMSPSGFYAWQQRGPAARTLQDEVLTRQLRLVHADAAPMGARGCSGPWSAAAIASARSASLA
jgi:hypothetical protein